MMTRGSRKGYCDLCTNWCKPQVLNVPSKLCIHNNYLSTSKFDCVGLPLIFIIFYHWFHSIILIIMLIGFIHQLF